MTAWRPLLRVARRDALRHKGRSLLIVLLVGVPVAAMCASLTLGRSAQRSPEQDASSTMGQADLQVVASGVANGDWQALLPEGSRAVSTRNVFQIVAVIAGDELFEPELLEADLEDPLMHGLAEVVEGRSARSPDEVVVSLALAADLGLALGDRLTLARPDREVTVVGLGVRPGDLRRSAFFVPAGWSGDAPGDAMAAGRPVEWLVDVGIADASQAAAALNERFAQPGPASTPGEWVLVPGISPPGSDNDRAYVDVLTRSHLLSSDDPGASGELSVTYVAGVLALVWTGAVAAASFAVGARRRLREVGLVAAAGGTPGHLRRMLLADGLVLGLAGALGGVVVGLAVAAAARPHLDRLVGYAVDDLRIPVTLLAGAAAVGCLAAVLAALAPARSAARVPVLSALVGLRPIRARAPSWLTVGVVALVAGVALAWRGGSSGSEAAVNAGVVLVVFGVGATTAPLLGLVARFAGAAPLSLRLAARDAGRSRGRAGPATVAAMLGLAGAVGASAMFQSYEARAPLERVAFLDEDQLRVDYTHAGPEPTAAEVDAVLRAALRAVPGATGGRLGNPGNGDDEVFTGFGASVDLGEGLVASGLRPGSVVAVGDLAALEAMGATAAREALEAGQVVALNGGTVDGAGTVTLRGVTDGQVEEVATLPAVEVEGEAFFGLPNYLISAAAAESLGLATRPSAVVVRSPRPVTDADVRRVNLAVLEAVPSVPVYAQRETDLGTGAFVVPAMLGAGALVALFVVGLVTALSREELRPHLGTLAAVGAAPSTRRRLVAAQSGLLAGMAALLAVPAGLVPAVTLLRARSGDVQMLDGTFAPAAGAPLVVVPWLAIAALVVGVTLVATAGGGLLTRSRLHAP